MSEKKVLVVDDEMHILRIVKYKLESAGYHVFTALNGPDALTRVAMVGSDLALD